MAFKRRSAVMLPGLIAVLVLATVFLMKPLLGAASGAFAWLAEQGDGAIILLGICYFPCAVLALPVSWLTAVAGAICGVPIAVVLATICANAAATLAFTIGRRLGRERFQHWIDPYPKLKIVEDAIVADAFRIALLARLSPVSPYGVLSYILSVMPVRFRDFLLATVIGKTPGNLFYAFLGAGARSAADAAVGRAEHGTEYYFFLGVGIAATLIFMIVVTRTARRALHRAKRAG